MFKYILKRIMFFIPTLFIISVLTFALSKMAPGDPVQLALGKTQSDAGQQAEKIADEKAYMEMAEKMGLNLPVFYFDINPASVPDTLYRIPKKAHRKVLERLTRKYGNWQEVSNYYKSIEILEADMFSVTRDSINDVAYRKIRTNISNLYTTFKEPKIERLLSEISESADSDSSFVTVLPQISRLNAAFKDIKAKATPIKNYIPNINWYGFANQYHHWLAGNAPWFASEEEQIGKRKGFLRFDFGDSYLDKRPVWSILKDALPITIRLNVIAIILAYLIAIPLGVFSAVKRDTLFDKISTVSVFALYSLPVFWIASLLIVFFTNPEYGMDFFPSHGLKGDLAADASWFAQFKDKFMHLVLPIFCMTYGSLAYLSRQMRGGVLAVFRADYIRTARAKGLPEKKIVWKHAFRNSLVPIITIFASIFPAAIGGALVIEMIFSIPGMGKIMFGAIVARNYPIVFTVMMFAAILTMVGNLVADLLYAAVDPRISFTKKAG